MSDDLKKTKPHDASRVNLNEIWEVTYWCKKFNCTKSELINAVKSVGTSVEKVRMFLKK